MSKTIYNADYSECLPEALKKDPKMVALANATAAALLDTSGIMNSVLIYSRFDELPEELVDILAYDLHVDWYDYSYPIEVKRRTIRDSIQVHRRLGTKYAVEKALGAVYPGTKVEEWFEYGGQPYWFKIQTSATLTKDGMLYFLNMIDKVKNARSHVEMIEVTRTIQQPLHGGTAYHSFLSLIHI